MRRRSATLLSSSSSRRRAYYARKRGRDPRKPAIGNERGRLTPNLQARCFRPEILTIRDHVASVSRANSTDVIPGLRNSARACCLPGNAKGARAQPDRTDVSSFCGDGLSELFPPAFPAGDARSVSQSRDLYRPIMCLNATGKDPVSAVHREGRCTRARERGWGAGANQTSGPSFF